MIIGVGAWRGLGASTTATSIAVHLATRGWSPWLVEADPAGGVLAARLEGAPIAAGTLETIAFPARRVSPLDRFQDAASWWSGVRVISAPGDPFRAFACHHPRLAWAPTLRELDGPVVVDVGRLRGGGPVAAVLQQLDVLLLVSSADVVDLVATAEWAALHGRVAASDQSLPVDISRVVVVDAPIASSRASRAMVDYELGDRFAAWLPWSPDAIDLLRRGTSPIERHLRRHPLTQANDQLVDRLLAWAPPSASPAPPSTTATATALAPPSHAPIGQQVPS